VRIARGALDNAGLDPAALEQGGGWAGPYIYTYIYININIYIYICVYLCIYVLYTECPGHCTHIYICVFMYICIIYGMSWVLRAWTLRNLGSFVRCKSVVSGRPGILALGYRRALRKVVH